MRAREIIRGVFRVSIVIAVLTAFYVGYQDRIASVAEYETHLSTIRTIECGARIPEDRLLSAHNELGLIDLSKVGCARELIVDTTGARSEVPDLAGVASWN